MSKEQNGDKIIPNDLFKSSKNLKGPSINEKEKMAMPKRKNLKIKTLRRMTLEEPDELGINDIDDEESMQKPEELSKSIIYEKMNFTSKSLAYDPNYKIQGKTNFFNSTNNQPIVTEKKNDGINKKKETEIKEKNSGNNSKENIKENEEINKKTESGEKKEHTGEYMDLHDNIKFVDNETEEENNNNNDNEKKKKRKKIRKMLIMKKKSFKVRMK